jgi:F0F1-type ATP synthase epsilon subunit
VTPVGSIGLEAKHEPFIAVLRENSTLTYKTDNGEETSLNIINGMLSFKENFCIITGVINTF